MIGGLEAAALLWCPIFVLVPSSSTCELILDSQPCFHKIWWSCYQTRVMELKLLLPVRRVAKYLDMDRTVSISLSPGFDFVIRPQVGGKPDLVPALRCLGSGRVSCLLKSCGL